MFKTSVKDKTEEDFIKEAKPEIYNGVVTLELFEVSKLN